MSGLNEKKKAVKILEIQLCVKQIETKVDRRAWRFNEHVNKTINQPFISLASITFIQFLDFKYVWGWNKKK